MRVWLTYSGIAGFLLGIFIQSVWPTVPVDVLFLLLLTLTLFVVGVRCSTQPESKFVLAASLCTFCFVAGHWHTSNFVTKTVVTVPTDETLSLVGAVYREPEQRERTTHLYVATEETNILVFTDRYSDISYGDRVQVTGSLRQPASFETDLGRTFDYQGYLLARGVTHTMTYGKIEKLSSNEGNPVITHLLELKSKFLVSIEQHLPEPQAGLAQGLLLGVKRALGDELETDFRRTGIIHIVVLSGYNIMLVVAFVLYFLSFIFSWRGRVVVGIAAIVSFALLVGLSATVMRASLMAALALIARGFGRTYSVVQALFVAGVIMLLLNPYLLVYDVGFQLSFLATLGLIVVAPRLETLFAAVPGTIGVREFLVATLATQIFVLPILLYQIGEFSVVSVIVNVLVLPMVPVAMLSTFLLSLVSFVSTALATPFVWIAYGSLSYIVSISQFFSNLPFAAYVVPAFPFWIVLISYGMLGYGWYRWQNPATSDPLSGWTIEEESELPPGKTDVAPTPVFFR